MKVKNLKFWAAYILIFLLIFIASAFRFEIFELIVGIFMLPVFYAHELGHYLPGLLLGLNVKMVFKYWIIPQEVEYSWSDFFFQPAWKKIIVAFCGPLSGTITAFLIFRAIKRSQLNFMIVEFNKIWLRRFLLLIYLDGLLNQIMNFIPMNSNFYNDGALILLFLNQNEILNKILPVTVIIYFYASLIGNLIFLASIVGVLTTIICDDFIFIKNKLSDYHEIRENI